MLRLTRPDKSVKTYWREELDEAALKDPALEVVLPDSAEITALDVDLLTPLRLPGLWTSPAISVQAIYDYFTGGKVVKVNRGSYEEPVVIPKASPEIVDSAIHAAVKEGKLWLTAGPASLLSEEIPAGVLSAAAMVQAPPEGIPATQLLPQNLSAAWKDGESTALSMAVALSQQHGKTLPWATVRQAIDGALRARLLERTESIPLWPCAYPHAASVKVRVPKQGPPGGAGSGEAKYGIKSASAELRANELQDLADAVAKISAASAGHELKYLVRIDLGGDKPAPDAVVEAVNGILGSVSSKLKLE